MELPPREATIRKHVGTAATCKYDALLTHIQMRSSAAMWGPMCGTKRRFAKVTQSREKAPTRAIYWLKAPTCAFRYKSLLTIKYLE